MANTFVALTRPAGNGAGAAVDTSGLGASQTIIVSSSGGVYEPLVLIEGSNDGNNWFPIATFNGPNTLQVAVAAAKMRMNVSRFTDGVVPNVDVGANSDTIDTVTLVAPSTPGSGAAVDTSALGLFKTIQVSGTYAGTVNIDISNDGGVTWVTQMTFVPGTVVQSIIMAAQQMRVTRPSIPSTNPNIPVVAIGAAQGGKGGGGGGGNVTAFVYTAKGTETASFTMSIPTRPDLAYVAIAADGGRVDGTLSFFVCPIAQYTLTSIEVKCTQAPANGDQIIILIAEVTPLVQLPNLLFAGP